MPIVRATVADIHKIQKVVKDSWPDTYGPILGDVQLEYMIKLLYADSVLQNSFNQDNQAFYLFLDEGAYIGFAGIEHLYQGQPTTRLHKLYLVTKAQGKGAGKALLMKVIEKAKSHGSTCVSLNVNRYNQQAIEFYKRMGFSIAGEEDIDIGNGFFMNDYKMALKL